MAVSWRDSRVNPTAALVILPTPWRGLYGKEMSHFRWRWG